MRDGQLATGPSVQQSTYTASPVLGLFLVGVACDVCDPCKKRGVLCEGWDSGIH